MYENEGKGVGLGEGHVEGVGEGGFKLPISPQGMH